jgi:hypothetical protein
MKLNWNEEEYEHYDGHDLILGTAVPGSKWSGTLMTLANVIKYINNSDIGQPIKYGRTFTDKKTGEVINYDFHYGTYWGPSHEYGHGFDNLKSMAKKEIIDEFAGGFTDWTKTKLIKSHWFVYELEYLITLFPKATIIGMYLSDDYCFKWWNFLGGWDITYPIYDWFDNDDKMKREIKIGNALILKFFSERGIPLKLYPDFPSLFNTELGMNVTADDIIPIGEFSSLSETGHRRRPHQYIGVYNPQLQHKNTNVYMDEVFKMMPGSYDVFTRLIENDK